MICKTVPLGLAAHRAHNTRFPRARASLESVSMPQAVVQQSDRNRMRGDNKLIIGLFGSNCSSGRAVTLVAERWSGEWDDILRLAKTRRRRRYRLHAPDRPLEGLRRRHRLPGRHLRNDHLGHRAARPTKRITVFGTVHAPFFNPIIAAKMMVTADHVGHGRFGLNIVCGWNEDEFDMFGVTQRDHERRYEFAQEWWDAIQLIWSDKENFDFNGEHLKLKGIRAKPKPYGGSRPVVMNAGASPNGRAFAIRNCDAFFTQADRTSLGEITPTKSPASSPRRKELGRDMDVYTVGVVTCRPTIKEAKDYHHSPSSRRADWCAVDGILKKKNISPETVGREKYRGPAPPLRQRHGRLPTVGDPDSIASELADLSKAGLRGIAISLVNYLDELPYFLDEVIPRLRRLELRA